jgi:PadR family transcriptional regulator AphA
MSTTGTLTPTSYAILGLLAVKPWTTYELAKQVDQTLSRFWPRARSKLYEEPKKLASAGLATATPSATGRRRSTVYAITRAGRLALADWLARDSDPPIFESEHLLKVFYAENGSTEQLRATLADLRRWAIEKSGPNVEIGSRYLAGTGAHPERLPTLVLTSRFLDDYLELLDRWVAWAETVIADWPSDPATATPDLAALQQTVDHARRRIERSD